jgi:hypothetical protein
MVGYSELNDCFKKWARPLHLCIQTLRDVGYRPTLIWKTGSSESPLDIGLLSLEEPDHLFAISSHNDRNSSHSSALNTGKFAS